MMCGSRALRRWRTRTLRSCTMLPLSLPPQVRPSHKQVSKEGSFNPTCTCLKLFYGKQV